VAERTRFLYLETDQYQKLDRTVKYDEILKGAFGTIYANRTCFYGRPVANGPCSVSVGSYLNQLEHEIPAELSGSPANLPALTSVSLVRIFRADLTYAVVSANYESTGELGSLHIDETKSGDWVSGCALLHLDLKNSDLKRYGIPARIDVPEYLRSRRVPLPVVTLPEELTLLNQHYGHNKIIRVDKLRDGAVDSSRFLHPSVTEEERVLDTACESRFSIQRSIGLPTVD
jgi:hypothetical protein